MGPDGLIGRSIIGHGAYRKGAGMILALVLTS
jgi:hypothetical protein